MQRSPFLFISLMHILQKLLSKEIKRAGLEGVVDTILKIGSLGIVSSRHSKDDNRRTIVCSGDNIFSRTKERNETRYFKTYSGITKHLKYTKDYERAL